jgi:protein JSN1
MQRNVSMDSNNYPDAYGNGLVTPQYTHSPAMSNAGISPMNPQQMQYQQALLAQAQSQMQRPPGYYGSPGGMNNMTPVSGMQNGMAYGTASPGQQMVDPYRQAMNGSPMMPPGIGYQQQGYSSPMMGMNGYGQYQMPPYFQQGQMQQGQMAGQGQRRRVS